jgi:hypothetical protein
MLSTCRFTNLTWKENCIYRNELQIPGCIYGVPIKMNDHITGPIYIIEMNNDTNKIQGIGLITNRIEYDKYHNIYKSDSNYNRYIYKGEHRINRQTLELYNLQLVKTLDHILFKGKTHLKRGIGMTIIPQKLLVGLNIHMDIILLFKEIANLNHQKEKEIEIDMEQEIREKKEKIKRLNIMPEMYYCDCGVEIFLKTKYKHLKTELHLRKKREKLSNLSSLSTETSL